MNDKIPRIIATIAIMAAVYIGVDWTHLSRATSAKHQSYSHVHPIAGQKYTCTPGHMMLDCTLVNSDGQVIHWYPMITEKSL